MAARRDGRPSRRDSAAAAGSRPGRRFATRCCSTAAWSARGPGSPARSSRRGSRWRPARISRAPSSARVRRFPAAMLDDVLAIPDHLRDALWRVESARLEPGESAGLLVCGMGGSAIGGDLAGAALGDRLTRPLLTVRGYELPSWATPEWTVLCSSYSGETEETLACFEAAEALGARRIVVSTGGALVEAARAAGVPVIGLPGMLPAAARRGRLHVRLRRRGRRAGRRRAAHRRRRSRRRRLSRGAAARTCRHRAAEIAAAPRAAPAGHLRRRSDRAGGAALEDPGQREREAARLLLRAAGGRPQRALRLGRPARPAPAGRGAARRLPTSIPASGVASS